MSVLPPPSLPRRSATINSNTSLRFTAGGDTWTPSRVVMWGQTQLWSPVLFFDTASSRLLLFYTESRKACSPGGDIKYISTLDLGQTWTPPQTIYTHEADGEAPKVIASRPAVDAAGAWYLAFHSEPQDSYKSFNNATWCELKEVPGGLPPQVVPPAAAPQSTTTAAGVLVSRDAGASWTVAGHIEDPKTWLIQPALEWCAASSTLLALFRTDTGRAYASRSSDSGVTWTQAAPTTLLNPNSKFATVTIDGQIVAAYNPSATSRASVALALSVNAGKTWEPLTVVDDGGPAEHLSSPAIVRWSDDSTVKVAYAVWGRGLKLATVKLETVDG